MPGAQLAAGLGGQVKLPPHLLAALVPLLVLFAALDIYCLIDLARAKSVRHAPKLAWVIVILAVSAPLGALLYLFAGKDRGQQPGAATASGRIELAAAAELQPPPSRRPGPSTGPAPPRTARARPSPRARHGLTSPPGRAPGRDRDDRRADQGLRRHRPVRRRARRTARLDLRAGRSQRSGQDDAAVHPVGDQAARPGDGPPGHRPQPHRGLSRRSRVRRLADRLRGRRSGPRPGRAAEQPGTGRRGPADGRTRRLGRPAGGRVLPRHGPASRAGLRPGRRS